MKDKIIDIVLSKFRELVRPSIHRGLPVNLEDCLERAISEVGGSSNESIVRNRIWPKKEMIREQCRKVIFEIQKRDHLLDIKKTGAGSILDELAEKSQYPISYKLRATAPWG